jgi:hypothetical protein
MSPNAQLYLFFLQCIYQLPERVVYFKQSPKFIAAFNMAEQEVDKA